MRLKKGGWVVGALLLGATLSGVEPKVGAEVPVSSNVASAARANNSPMLAVDPTEQRFVALSSRLDAPDFGCRLHLSGNSGRGWVPANPVPNLPPGAEKCYAPEVGFDSAGNLYYLFVGLRGTGNEPMGVFLTVSRDRGRTFSEPRKILGPFSYMVRMAIDTSISNETTIHIVWLKANSDPGLGSLPPPPNPIMAMHSRNGGKSFSSPVQVSDPSREKVVAPGVALGPKGEVYVAYYDLMEDGRDYHGLEGPTWDGEWSMMMSASLDRGRRFKNRSEIDSHLKPPGRVMLIFTMPAPTVAANAGSVWVAWPDARSGDSDVLVSRSINKGRSWPPPFRLNDDPMGDGTRQYLPRISTAENGRVDAIFYDGSGRAGEIDVSYAFLNRGSERFSRAFRVTKKTSDSRIGQRYLGPAAQGSVEYGSRLATLSYSSSVLTAWTDTRNARVSPYQDIFAARVGLSRK